MACAIWQVADIALLGLGLPHSAISLVLILSLLGFAIALVMTWAYEVRPDAPPDPMPTPQARAERATPEEGSSEEGGRSNSATATCSTSALSHAGWDLETIRGWAACSSA